MVKPRVVATSEKNVKLVFLNDQAKQLKSAMVWKSYKLTNFVDKHFELVFPPQLHLCLHGYPQFSRMNSSLYL